MMKKLILTVFAGAVFSTAAAQEGFTAGGHVGFQTGDASSVYGFNLGADLSYLVPVIDNLWLGGLTGLDFFTGKDAGHGTRYKTLTMLPVAGSARYDVADEFYVGLDLGFAVGVSSHSKTGFLFQPKGGWQSDDIQAYVFVKNISTKNKGNFTKRYKGITTIGVGAAYKF